LLGGIAGALVLTCAPASAEPHRWSLSVSPPVTWLQPAGSYRPIGPDNVWSFAIRATLAREDIHLALRLEAQSLGGDGQTFPDSLASVHGVPVGSPVDASVYNRETFWTAVLEWNPRADRSGPYAFAGAGGFRLSGTVLGTDIDMLLPDAPVLPANRVHLCMLGGAGARVVRGRNHNHSFYAEAAWLHSGPADWVATPAARSDLGHTIFPDAHFRRHEAVCARDQLKRSGRHVRKRDGLSGVRRRLGRPVRLHRSRGRSARTLVPAQEIL